MLMHRDLDTRQDPESTIKRLCPGKHAVASDVNGERTAAVEVRSLVKRFRRGDGTIVNAVDRSSIRIARGEFVVLLGPSGCGKTTLLRCIAGLEKPDSGEIEISGRKVYSSRDGISLASEERGLSMIFQSYALWPHMSVFKNVAYPLTCQIPRVSKTEIEARVHRVLKMVGISELAYQYPNQMSGGQQQRTALARALVAGSDVVLFDEPLSNVDAKVREQLRFEMLSMQAEFGFAAVYVTHDQAEAMQLANRIAVLDAGQIVQLQSPRVTYEAPATRHVANFIGTTNEIDATVVQVADTGVVVDTGLGRLCGSPGPGANRTGAEVVALWRPERCKIVPADDAARGAESVNKIEGRIQASLFCGTHVEHLVRAGESNLRVWSGSLDPLAAGTAVRLEIKVADLRILPRAVRSPMASSPT